MKILFLGDFFYDLNDFNKDIDELSEYIKINDFTVCLNLEAPMKSDKPFSKWVNLYNSELIKNILIRLNVKFVCLANNHMFDYGYEGYSKLISVLDDINIIYFGAGYNTYDANNLKLFEVDGYKLGFLAFGSKQEGCLRATSNKPGVSLIDSQVYSTVLNAKKKCDYLIVSLHWGFEFEIIPEPVNRYIAREISEHGADLIIGHHPHVPQPKEINNDSLIYYSLGNFYFGSRRSWFKKHCRFDNAKNYSHKGIGVVLDTKKLFNLDKEELEVYYSESSDRTSFNNNYTVNDLNSINLHAYNGYYKKNYSKRYPALLYNKNTKWMFFVNDFKLYYFNTKLKLKSLIKKVIYK